LLLIFEIAAGIVLGVCILAALPKILEFAIWGFVAFVGVAIALTVYLLWSANKDESLVLLAVATPVLLGAYIYDRPRRRAEAKAKVLAIENDKAQADAAFKVFLVESLERRKKREEQKNAK
jgi:hypothetical protein